MLVMFAYVQSKLEINLMFVKAMQTTYLKLQIVTFRTLIESPHFVVHIIFSLLLMMSVW